MLKTVSSIVNALGALNYKGTWNADTNTPTLASGVGVQGDYYVVSVSGSTDLDGTTNWGVGDWAAFNGSIWERLEGGADGNFVNLSVSGLSSLNGGANVVGSVTADSFQTDTANTNTNILARNSSSAAVYLQNGGTGDVLHVRSGSMAAGQGDLHLKVANNGDISFYSSDGLSQALFWDASAEFLGINTTNPAGLLEINGGTGTATSGGTLIIRQDGDANTDGIAITSSNPFSHRIWKDVDGKLNIGSFNVPSALVQDLSGNLGIGTISPSARLDIVSSATGGTTIELDNTSAGGRNFTLYSSGSGNSFGAGNFALYDADAAAVRLLVDSSGQVGIGTDSPATPLHVAGGSSGTNQSLFRASSGGGGGLQIVCSDLSVANPTWQLNTFFGEQLAFGDGTSEHGRWDASGNFLVGKTSADVTTVGTELRANGLTWHTTDGIECLGLNRLTSDGDLIEFRRGTAVGSIGVVNTDNIRIGGTVASHAGIQFGTNILIPETAGTVSDGLVDIGTASNRYKNLYLSAGVVFGATGGSVSSKTLDDYEEGTWTPVMFFNNGNAGITYSQQDGVYTKVGRLVTAYIRVNLTSNGTDTGVCEISLPFQVADAMSTTAVQGGAPVVFVTNFTGDYYELTAHPWEGLSKVKLYQRTSVGGDGNIQATESEISDTFDCRITVQFMTA